ncbi:MAG: phage portal protein [Lachnospiraceae bacterium]|nr:phage portal protein [Lachnospiraceae bacterium]
MTINLEDAKKLIKDYMPGHSAFVVKADIGERYYRNQTDILFRKKRKGGEEEETKNPLRNADNRISHNFQGMLVNQKAAYMFTYPPLFDVGNKSGNRKIIKALGTKFRKICKKLCINASNTGIAWIHYWEGDDKKFHYAVIDSRQIIPVWTDDQERRLKAVMRTYNKVLDDGKTYIIYEIWTEKCCESFAQEVGNTIELMLYYSMFERCIIDIDHAEGNIYNHEWGRVPFIPFYNNDMETSDLDNIKGLIDTYDKVYSGFVDDLEDIQEILFVLSGYGGTDIAEFLSDLKKYKTVSLDEDEGAGLTTLTIDIPVEAREKMLAMTRKEIFEQGQGVDPQPENYGNASGEALKFMYALLELKAGLMEVEFQLSLEEVIQAVCGYLGISCDEINQTWTRNMIKNDKELADMCASSTGILSQKTVVKNHPFVENPEEEMEQIEREKEQSLEQETVMMYGKAFKGQQDKDGEQTDAQEDEE